MNTTESAKYVYKIIASPFGKLRIVASDAGLTAIVWADKRSGTTRVPVAREDSSHPIIVEIEKQLREYFTLKRRKFDIPLDLSGTKFQKKVWKALLDIPYGETVSYADIAKRIGSPKAVRAVGNANNKNPICIIAACHRVVSSAGTLTGYAGGLGTKAALLTHESVVLDQSSRPGKNTKIMRNAN